MAAFSLSSTTTFFFWRGIRSLACFINYTHTTQKREKTRQTDIGLCIDPADGDEQLFSWTDREREREKRTSTSQKLFGLPVTLSIPGI